MSGGRDTPSPPPGAEPPGAAVAGRFATRHAAEEAALVLRARGVDHVLVREDGAYVLRVPAALAAGARTELESFARENASGAPRTGGAGPAPGAGGAGGTGGTGGTGGAGAAALFALLQGLGFGLQLGFAPAYERGAQWIGSRVRAGEVWRCVTAQFVHADALHFAGNLGFGALFVAGAAQRFGAGVALLATFACGALGYGLDAYLNTRVEVVRGASIGVMAALGLLAAGSWRGSPPGPARPLVKRIAPAVAGLVLFALLTPAAGRVDALGHFFGLATGAAAGFLLAPSAGRLSGSRRAQALAFAACVLGLGASAAAALR